VGGYGSDPGLSWDGVAIGSDPGLSWDGVAILIKVELSAIFPHYNQETEIYK
jgi:hypothetical protein